MLSLFRRSAPYVLLVSVALLSAFGIAMLYSTTAYRHGEFYLTRQFIWIVAGGAAAIAVNLVGYRRLGRWSPWLVLGAALPLMYLAGAHALDIAGVPNSILGKLPLVGHGATKGAWRWLRAGPISVQPSEFAKIAIILFLARYYSANPRYVDTFRKGLLLPMAVVGAVLFMVLLGGSLSITAITGMVVIGMLLVAGIRLRYFLIFLVAGLALLLAAMIVSPERVERLTSFRDPEAQAATAGYQLWVSQLALGSGSWTGVGFNQSRLKQDYLPESHTDFILAIAGEELGYLGVIGVIAVYLILIGASFAISVTAVDREGMFLGFGVGLSLGLHAFANLGVVSGFLPTTGVTAPLISYGGSSMVSTWLGVGLLLSVARTAHAESSVEEEASQPERPDPVLIKVEP